MKGVVSLFIVGESSTDVSGAGGRCGEWPELDGAGAPETSTAATATANLGSAQEPTNGGVRVVAAVADMRTRRTGAGSDCQPNVRFGVKVSPHPVAALGERFVQ
ncbi:hypothetical protein GCM10020254_51550 [Streptomyces goshikiensis]